RESFRKMRLVEGDMKPNNPNEAEALRQRLRQAAHDEFVFHTLLTELSDSELRLLEEICDKYLEKRRDLQFTLIGPYPRPDLDSLPRKWLRKLTHRSSSR